MICADFNCNVDREAKMVVVARDGAGEPSIWSDPCIAPIVAALNQADVATLASCCGHRRRPASIMLADGREIIIARSHAEARLIDAMFPDVNGEAA